jgi:unsaturated chondroitin disaccharide hydrolase
LGHEESSVVKISDEISAQDLRHKLHHLFDLGAAKTIALNRRWRPENGAPVFTAGGKYTARAWTQWTQGFQYGNALLCFDVTGDPELLRIGREHTIKHMAEHLTHIGVHDHGFNNLSTYGQLRRLMLEKRIPFDPWELNFYELALKVSGAVQAARWTPLSDVSGYIYSFNGPHSLFIDTIRTLRVCAVAHQLGHSLLGEQDARVNLLQRVLAHLATTAKYNVYYGDGRDSYDTPEHRGRTVHEAIFNPVSRTFRCPSTQQGYSPFSTWTRGLAWAVLGFAEQLEFLHSLPEEQFSHCGGKSKGEVLELVERSARATCDFYIEQGSAADGICYWDTGAPNLHQLGDWRSVEADPYNAFEPVDASASAIAAQGLLRLGTVLKERGTRYVQAGLGVAGCLLDEEYLFADLNHEGILRHSVYHRPNGWDSIPSGHAVPSGESSMWGDYHVLELGLTILRISQGGGYTFYQSGESAE